jgi:hypothetical protein
MSTPRFRMRSITAWSALLTAEEGVLAPEEVERLEAAYERAKQLVAALPFTYDPLWLLTGHRPEGWEYLTGALSPAGTSQRSTWTGFTPCRRSPQRLTSWPQSSITL